MHQTATALRHTPLALPEIADEDLARHSEISLLITASAEGVAAALARRIHDASVRAPLPFVRVPAVELRVSAQMFRDRFCTVLAAAAGGTVFLDDVEELAPMAQDLLLEVLEERDCAPATLADVRLVSGTTVSLFERIACGSFSERLFYRLNTIHLTAF